MLMERRDFLKIAFGVAAGAATFAVTAQAAPLAPLLLNQDARAPAGSDAHPAVTTGDEVDGLKPEQVRWHHGNRHWHHRRWHHHRHWGWRRRHWRRHHHWRRW
jgi:hypothetical protein